jgi:hypothetical protein|tara:strand:+ start:758 stop:970 length:213 start_codon:yes stop_codon:yes gene_type:complete
MKKPAVSGADLDLALAIICAISPPEQTWTLPDIADVCGCSISRIWKIEQAALNKARNSAYRNNYQVLLEE